jgi:DNA sulfur modification protein DndE
MSDPLTLDRLSTLRFRPSKEADEFLSYLRNTLITGERYRVGRLAIARSLHEADPVRILEKGTEMASAIEGTHLFGEDKSLWACLLVQSATAGTKTGEDFRQLVEAHWHRGAEFLKRDWDDARKDPVEFAISVARRLGSIGPSAPVPAEGTSFSSAAARLTIPFGEVSIDLRNNKRVDITVNSPGASPHIAIMGKTRSGKSRTGIFMAQQLAAMGRLPVLFIDPKGDFVRDGQLVPVPDWGGRTLADRFPDIRPLDVPGTPVPLDFLALPPRASDVQIGEAAIQFRDSFKKCIKAKGDVQMDALRMVVHDLLQQSTGPISLDGIRDAVRRNAEREGKRPDGVQAKLNELTSLRLFEPKMSAAEFFSKRWVIGLNRASDESKRLVIFLVLDALANHLLSRENAPTDTAGHRAGRQLLVVDEAKEILPYRHGALSRLIRQSASKGGIVMLLSQSPEEFDQEADDFLSQMGTIGVFTSSAKSVTSLSAALGRKVRPEEFSDVELQPGVALVKRPGAEASRVIAWKK